jgi:hypothetical protein
MAWGDGLLQSASFSPAGLGLLGAGTALLDAGGPSRTPRNFGQALSQGLQGGLQGVQMGLSIEQQKQQQRLANFRALAQAAQMEQAQMQAQAQKAAFERLRPTLPNDQQALFDADPQGFLKSYTESKFPKAEASPEIIKLQNAAAGLPAGSPERAQIEQRIRALGTENRGTTVVNRLPPQFSPPASGYQYELDQGTGMPIRQMPVPGGPADPARQTQANVTRIQEELGTLQDKGSRLSAIEQSWRPEYNTIPTQLYTQFLTAKDRVGLGLAPEQQDFLSKATTAQQSVVSNLNATIKETTGAAMGVTEAERIMKEAPNETDSPTQFAAKLKSTTEKLRLAYARKNYALRNNIAQDLGKDNTGGISLDDMKGIINKRGQEIAASLPDAKPNDPRVLQQLKSEFGF